MPTQIVATRLNGEDQLAMVQTASLGAMALLALLLFRSDPREAVGGGGRKGAGPTRIAIRRPLARLLAGVAGWGLATLLLLPHLTLVLVSFVPVGTWTTEPLPPAYTLHNYETLVLERGTTARCTRLSFQLSGEFDLDSVGSHMSKRGITGDKTVRISLDPDDYGVWHVWGDINAYFSPQDCSELKKQ